MIMHFTVSTSQPVSGGVEIEDGVWLHVSAEAFEGSHAFEVTTRSEEKASTARTAAAAVQGVAVALVNAKFT